MTTNAYIYLALIALALAAAIFCCQPQAKRPRLRIAAFLAFLLLMAGLAPYIFIYKISSKLNTDIEYAKFSQRVYRFAALRTEENLLALYPDKIKPDTLECLKNGISQYIDREWYRASKDEMCKNYSLLCKTPIEKVSQYGDEIYVATFQKLYNPSGYFMDNIEALNRYALHIYSTGSIMADARNEMAKEATRILTQKDCQEPASAWLNPFIPIEDMRLCRADGRCS